MTSHEFLNLVQLEIVEAKIRVLNVTNTMNTASLERGDEMLCTHISHSLMTAQYKIKCSLRTLALGDSLINH